MKNRALYPVLFGFFIMGFCDVVGIATSYIKLDFNLSESLAGFIPTAVFIWFLILSVPTALLMNRIGRKRTVQLSNLATIIGMLVPLYSYNFTSCMVGFALLGIGNTMLQVSLNPLLTDVVSGDNLTSSLTAGQVVKAVSSFCGPFIALFAVKVFGSWQSLFPIYCVLTLLAALWLMITSIDEKKVEKKTHEKNVFKLLADKNILLLFIGIVAVVGLDVGMNTLMPKLLIERTSMEVAEAGLGSSAYFICRTCGAFVGTFLLSKMSDVRYFRVNMSFASIVILSLFFVYDKLTLIVLSGLVGFLISSIFAVIFSLAIKSRPNRANEISGLMITGVFGGAIIPPLMGIATDAVGSQVGSIIIILICSIYLLSCSFMFAPSRKLVTC
jgi:FHS family L-fucose permease-like MFS transporter